MIARTAAGSRIHGQKARRSGGLRTAVRETHDRSLTALAGEAIRLGAATSAGVRLHQEDEIPHEGRLLRCGDPDERVLEAEYVGDDVPGGSAPTPDQNLVDEIGRAYGLEEEDSGPLRASSEILAARDHRRAELRSRRRRR